MTHHDLGEQKFRSAPVLSQIWDLNSVVKPEDEMEDELTVSVEKVA